MIYLDYLTKHMKIETNSLFLSRNYKWHKRWHVLKAVLQVNRQ